MQQERIAYSCLVDGKDIFLAQSYILVNSLLRLRKTQPDQVFVHTIGVTNAEYLDWLKRVGVNQVQTSTFDTRNLYCNKLQQLGTFADKSFSHVILLDCDMAWVSDRTPRIGRMVGAKIVDLPNPPANTLNNIFNAAGLGSINAVPVTFPQSDGLTYTDRNNCNGGFYMIDTRFLPHLAESWKRWALWCIDNAALLGRYHNHADQIGFALAMRELREDTELFGAEWNFPTHLAGQHLPDVEPHLIHFHKELTPHFNLKMLNVEKADRAITKVNQTLNEVMSSDLLNSLFWSARYYLYPQMGSGAGTRGESLGIKRRLLAYSTWDFGNGSVIDVGCGDLEAVRHLRFTDYLGIDISAVAIQLARDKKPEWRFEVGTLDSLSKDHEADLIICLDVLIHQKSGERYLGLLQQLIDRTKCRLVVAGYTAPPTNQSEITAYHGSCLEYLQQCGMFHEIAVIGRYRDVSVIVADKRKFGAGYHANDMSADTFNLACTQTLRPDLLRLLADISRKAFGFYTKHYPRALEYPWFASKIEGNMPGARALEIGAGLSPLPLYLALQGIKVDCVDSHPLVRTRETRDQWNEWGYFDYSQISDTIRSHHVDIQDFQPNEKYEVIYSISVVEHMPRTIWEKTLELAASWLKPDGHLILTIDLMPGTDWLWNLAAGKVVEEKEVHGDIAAFIASIQNLGLYVVEKEIARNVPYSKTDILFIHARSQRPR
jgi:2-polyprenyl-3-methyl-5-hydroxy-6-metoxy-1,4-benzoquinol methylase